MTTTAARSEAELAFRGELDWLARHRGVRVAYLLGPRADRPSWLPRAAATGTGVCADHLHTEQFAW